MGAKRRRIKGIQTANARIAERICLGRSGGGGLMADGSIRISLEVDGRQVDMATHSLDDLEASAHKAGDGAKETEEGVRGAGNESQKAGSKVKKFASALGLVAIGA